MDGWMDVWMYGWMDVWMYGWMYGRIDIWMDGWMVGLMDVWVYGWMYVWMDGWMDGSLRCFATKKSTVYPSNSTRTNLAARANWSVDACASFCKNMLLCKKEIHEKMIREYSISTE